MKDKFTKENLIKILKHPLVMYFIIAYSINFAVDILNQRSLFEAIARLFTHPLITLFNTLILMIPLTLGKLFKKRLFAVTLIYFPIAALVVGNFILQFFRNTPVSFVDFFLVISVFNIINTYLSIFEIILIVFGVTVVVYSLRIVYKKSKIKETDYKFTLICFPSLTTFVVLLGIFFNMIGVLSHQYGNLTLAYREYGLPYCFTMSIIDRGIDEPEDYDENLIETELKNIQEYLKQVDNSPANEDINIRNSQNPNVIFLQLETFIDPNTIKGLTFSEDPTPFFNSLKKTNPTGSLTVPTFGAGTANTEFEIISGMSLEFFGAGEYPYTSVLQSNTCESLAFLLKEEGYYATAIHNNRATFYDRHTVFNNLGFDRYSSIEFMTDVEYTQVGWAKDNVLINEISKTLKSSEESDFIYGISVQPHGKYPESLDEIENKKISVSIEEEPDNEKLIAEWTYLVNQLNEVDNTIKELTEMLNKLDEPTVLVMYGDHLPNFKLENEDVLLNDIFKTEYVVWSNYDYKLENKDLYTYQLGSHILQSVGCDTGNINLLHRTRDINPNYKETLWAFQYDILFSDKYLWDEQNQYVPAPVHLGYDDIKINSINYEDGILTVLGENFNLHSKIYINNKKYKPIYISKNQLELEIDELKTNASIKVSQVTDMNEVLYTTNSIINKSK